MRKFIFCLLGFAPSALNANMVLDDWQPCNNSNNYTDFLCSGFYKVPEKLSTQNKNSPNINVLADHIMHEPKNKSVFSGNVRLERNKQVLLTNKLLLKHDPITNKIIYVHAYGNLNLQDHKDEIRIDGSSATINYLTDEREIINPTFRFYKYHGFGWADYLLEKKKKNKFFLKNAHYTTCSPYNLSWQLKAKKIVLNKNSGRGQAWHSIVYVKNIPVFYSPYVDFPLDARRKSGLLTPSIGHSHSGNMLRLPLYLNLAPNYDATITTNYYSKRGIKFDNEFRYLSKQQSTNFKIFYLPKDRLYNVFRNKSLQDNAIGPSDIRNQRLRELTHRYGINWEHATQFNKNNKMHVIYHKVGDDNYIQDFTDDFIGYDAQHLEQTWKTQHYTNFGAAQIKMQQYQTLHPFEGPVVQDSFQTLPAITMQSKSFNVKNIMHAQTIGSVSRFKMNNTPIELRNTTSDRYHLRPMLYKNFETNSFFVTPSVKFDILKYNNVNSIKTNYIRGSYLRTVPIYSVDSGLFFTRDLTIKNIAYQQTLEPRVMYLYVPKRDHSKMPLFDSAPLTFSNMQVFYDNRYSGYDRQSDHNQIGLGVNSYFYNMQGLTKANFGLGRVYNFTMPDALLGENLKIKNKFSPWALDGSYYLNTRLSINASLVRQPLNVDQDTSIGIQYTKNNNIINITYNFIRNEILDPNLHKQLHTHNLMLSSAWNIKETKRLLGRVEYDINLKRLQRIVVGYEQEWCCTIVRFLVGQNIRPTENLSNIKRDTKLYLQLVLKGFTSAGNFNNDFLPATIPGIKIKDKFK